VNAAEQAHLHAACTVVELAARQLCELDLALGAGQRASARTLAKRLGTTAPLAIEALREIEPFIQRVGR
jgi:hypothetical protein